MYDIVIPTSPNPVHKFGDRGYDDDVWKSDSIDLVAATVIKTGHP